jgi:transketolase
MTATRPGQSPEPSADPSVGDLARSIRQLILDESKRANVGHIGSALSVADILAALSELVFTRRIAADPDRDRFVLAKGHAALALYAALHVAGVISRSELDTYCGNGTLLGVHPERELEGVDFSTGSLGHGLSYGVGASIAARLQRSDRRVYVLMSDAECNEGSVWEAAMFAAHHSLSNLVAIVDANAQQALGYTKDILDMAPLVRRWEAFGWDTREVDGHDPAALVNDLTNRETRTGPPHALIARTVFGKGVSFMEGRIEWHYLPMSDSQYIQAVREVADT